ncbi:MAG TPA: DUF58 domain-containing protein [Opitutaceae bacterium]|nr:DUF58 domain-containing protein [Opitutaceae bacterium]
MRFPRRYERAGAGEAMTNNTGAIDLDWHGPEAPPAWWREFKWSTLVWAMVFPARTQRIAPTLTGTLLIGLSLGIGMAAYNTANNILFIAFSLLLSCLILSGVMSWLNFSGMRWRLAPGPALRAGHDAAVGLELRNGKKFLPSYGLWFDLRARAPGAVDEGGVPKKSVREILAAVDRAETPARLFLRERLDAGGETRMEWIFRPARRGLLKLELAGVGSLFPFGFLKKTLGGGQRCEVFVWPAAADYRWRAVAATRRPLAGERVARPGQGADLLALRNYEPGDSHRLIHWKASARSGRLMVRQFAAEGAESFTLWLCSPAESWPRPEQFELAVSLAATLAEDLFRAGKLAGVAVNSGPLQTVRSPRDVEAFLDRLAVVERISETARREPGAGNGVPPGRRNVITLAPEGARGVSAYVDGEKTASA